MYFSKETSSQWFTEQGYQANGPLSLTSLTKTIKKKIIFAGFNLTSSINIKEIASLHLKHRRSHACY